MYSLTIYLFVYAITPIYAPSFFEEDHKNLVKNFYKCRRNPLKKMAVFWLERKNRCDISPQKIDFICSNISMDDLNTLPESAENDGTLNFNENELDNDEEEEEEEELFSCTKKEIEINQKEVTEKVIQCVPKITEVHFTLVYPIIYFVPCKDDKSAMIIQKRSATSSLKLWKKIKSKKN